MEGQTTLEVFSMMMAMEMEMGMGMEMEMGDGVGDGRKVPSQHFVADMTRASISDGEDNVFVLEMYEAAEIKGKCVGDGGDGDDMTITFKSHHQHPSHCLIVEMALDESSRFGT